MSSFKIRQDAVKDPEADLPFEIDFFLDCASFWRANEAFELAEFIRPSVANGFSYECTTAGTTNSEEPEWPTTLGGVVTSGSASFTCREAALNGVSAISSPTYTVEPTGELTVGDLAVAESTKLGGYYSGGTLDQGRYEVKFSFTLGGRLRIARHVVKIKKR